MFWDVHYWSRSSGKITFTLVEADSEKEVVKIIEEERGVGKVLRVTPTPAENLNDACMRRFFEEKRNMEAVIDIHEMRALSKKSKEEKTKKQLALVNSKIKEAAEMGRYYTSMDGDLYAENKEKLKAAGYKVSHHNGDEFCGEYTTIMWNEEERKSSFKFRN